MVRWMYAFPNIEKQINSMLTATAIFITLAVLFNYAEKTVISTNVVILSSILKWISIVSAVYFLVYALMLTRKWIEKKYK